MNFLGNKENVGRTPARCIIMAYKQDLDDMIRMSWKRFRLHRDFYSIYFRDFSLHWDIYLTDSDEIGAD